MVATDPLSLAYADLLIGQYDCVDRIILNAYFPLACSPGGFRTWWRSLHGNDDSLDNTHLMRMAGRFSRRVRGWAQKENIPVIDCAVGERKHDLAESHLPADPKRTGIFLVLVNRAPAPVWDVHRYGKRRHRSAAEEAAALREPLHVSHLGRRVGPCGDSSCVVIRRSRPCSCSTGTSTSLRERLRRDSVWQGGQLFYGACRRSRLATCRRHLAFARRYRALDAGWGALALSLSVLRVG